MAKKAWGNGNRWEGIRRPYTTEDVLGLRGSVHIEHSLARYGAERLWEILTEKDYVHCLGALTGNQAVQQTQAGLKAVYASGWQAAADGNVNGQMYPDLAIYTANTVAELTRRLNNALIRADQIDSTKGYIIPIVADGDAGGGGNLSVYELMRAMIEAGAAGVHFEDQLASAKKCGHMGGKVIVPTSEAIKKLVAARLASDVCGVSTILIARTDSDSARLVTTDIDPYDAPFIGDKGDRTPEGFYRWSGGIEAAISRGLAYAPYCDIIWCETSSPDLDYARRYAEGIHAKFPGKMLAYNCSPSFKWRSFLLSDEKIASFQSDLGAMGYKFQFVTLAGFHTLNHSMHELSVDYRERGMMAYCEKVQDREFVSREETGYAAVTHQVFVGTGYFDKISNIITGGSETTALSGSTEEAQF